MECGSEDYDKCNYKDYYKDYYTICPCKKLVVVNKYSPYFAHVCTIFPIIIKDRMIQCTIKTMAYKKLYTYNILIIILLFNNFYIIFNFCY